MRVLHVLNYGWPYIDGYTVRSMGLITAQRRHLDGVVPSIAVSPYPPLSSATDREFTLDGWGPDAQIHATTHGRDDLPRSWERPVVGLAPHTGSVFRRELSSIVTRLDPDVLHVHHPDYVARAAFDVAHEHGLPCVYEVRCFNGDYDLERYHPYFRIRGRVRNQYEYSACRRASAVVTIGDALADRVVDHAGVDPDDVTVVRNSVNTDLFHPGDDLGTPWGGDTLHVGYATTFARMENLDTLVRAAGRASRRLAARGVDLQLTIGGTGDDWERIDALVEENGLRDVVSLPGFIPYGDMPAFYRSLDLFVISRSPSKLTDQTTPLKPLEALASGVPVLSTDLPAMKELLGDRSDVRFTEATAEALAASMEAFASDPWGGTGRIEERSWKTEIQRYQSVYRSVTEPSPTVPPQSTLQRARDTTQSLLSGPKRVAKQVVRRAVEADFPGLQPLDTHVVICGFPRTGTTLLEIIIGACVDDALTLHEEADGLWAARHVNRMQAYMVTKRPRDIEQVEAIRAYYDEHPGRVHFLLPIRDPRDVLTSQHDAYPDTQGYYVSCERYRSVWKQVKPLLDAPDTTVVRYEELVREPKAVENQLARRIGWTVSRPFAQYHREMDAKQRDSMTEGALGGLRPLDPSGIGKWKQPKHQERLLDVLAQFPDLPQHLIDLGYEEDTAWVPESAPSVRQ